MKIFLALILSTLFSISAGSDVPNVTVKYVKQRQEVVSLEIHNGTDAVLTRLNAKGCFSDNNCTNFTFKGQFKPNEDSWTDDFHFSQIPSSIRIESVE